jgi:flagellar basal-body rod protein FlgF
LAVLASRAITTQRQFTAVADNVANVNTDGYRALNLDFKEVVSKPKGHPTASYVADRSITVDHSSGVMTDTGSPFDAAIAGDGFFAIDADGTTVYTRRGHFVLGSDGTLMTTEGNPVLDNAGGHIQVPTDAKTFKIAGDGTISTDQGQLATLGIYNFDQGDMGKLQRAGNTGFIPTNGANPQAMAQPHVMQGKIEASNVNAVEAMVDMQTVSKAYENALTNMHSLETLEDRSIRSLGGLQ